LDSSTFQRLANVIGTTELGYDSKDVGARFLRAAHQLASTDDARSLEMVDARDHPPQPDDSKVTRREIGLQSSTTEEVTARSSILHRPHAAWINQPQEVAA